MSLSAWLALVSGGARIKLKTDIDKPSNLAGLLRVMSRAFIKMACDSSVTIMVNVKMVTIESC